VLVVVVVVVGGAVVVGAVEVVVVVGGAVVVVGGAVVVVVPPQPASHALQQLGVVPTHACPPFGALHLSALDLVEHFSLPRALMRQHVTKPGLPQVERAAHFLTAAPQLGFAKAASFTALATQLTYCPWFSAAAQSQVAAAACAAAMSAASATGSHFASLRCAHSMTSDTATAVAIPEDRLMSVPPLG
jgi:hypothetical protein